MYTVLWKINFKKKKIQVPSLLGFCWALENQGLVPKGSNGLAKQ